MTRWQVPFVVGSVGRLAYGLGCVVAPEWMGGRLTPKVRDGDARMNLRGFGGAQSGVALFTLLAAASSPERARDALRLNMLVDGMDCAVSLLEWRDRGRLDDMAAGGVVFNITGLTCWALAHAALAEA